MNVALTRQARTDRAAILLHPRMQPETERVVWVDPVTLLRYAVHDAGASGRPYPELVRDGAELRAEKNQTLISSLTNAGWDTGEPALLHVDHRTGLARLRDGNHRTHFAAANGLPRVPVRIVPARVPNRGTTVAYPYLGEFDHAPAVL